MFKKGLIKGENKNHLQTIKKFRFLENLKVTMNFLSEVPLPQVVIQPLPAIAPLRIWERSNLRNSPNPLHKEDDFEKITEVMRPPHYAQLREVLMTTSRSINKNISFHSLMHNCDGASLLVVTDARQIWRRSYFTSLQKRRDEGERYNLSRTYG